MPDALLLTAISAVLRRTLENGLADPAVAESAGGDVLVTAQPLDQVGGGEERAQVNLCLYHLTPNSGLRPGRPDVARPYGVDLHYCVSAHGGGELVIETLLGAALGVLTERHSLDRGQIAAVLAAYTAADGGRLPPPAAAALGRSGLAERIAGLRLEQQFLSVEDSARLWSAAQARYRPSLYFRAAVAVLPA